MAFSQIKKRLSLNSENNEPVEETSPYEYDDGASGAELFKSIINKIEENNKPLPMPNSNIVASLKAHALGREPTEEEIIENNNIAQNAIDMVGNNTIGSIGRVPHLQLEKSMSKPKTPWDIAKEKATEKNITIDKATKDAFERQKLAREEAFRQRRENQYQESLKKLKKEN